MHRHYWIGGFSPMAYPPYDPCGHTDRKNIPHDKPVRFANFSKLTYRPLTRSRSARWPLPRERQRKVLVTSASPLGEAQIFLKIWVRGRAIKQSRSTISQIPSS